MSELKENEALKNIYQKKKKKEGIVDSDICSIKAFKIELASKYVAIKLSQRTRGCRLEAMKVIKEKVQSKQFQWPHFHVCCNLIGCSIKIL